MTVNGIDVILDCETGTEFQVFIRDDLRDLDLFNITVIGYLQPC